MARTRMPPIGKMPVSTAALRTSSTTAPMSTLLSRLAEYSMVKCGIAVHSRFFLSRALREVTAHRTVGSVVGLDGVALAGLDRTDERSRQHHLARFEGKPVGRNLVGEPCHRCGGMVEHARSKARLFQL